MSVKHGLLTILTEHALAGYDLRSEFEQRTGGTWPLNISQIDSDATLWNITDAGRAEAENWWYTATARSTPSREEASIKVTLAITSPYVDTAQVIRTQRTESLRALRDYTKLKSKLGPINSLSREDLAWAMLLDSYIFTLEAELRWLDHVESRIAMGFANLAPATPSATGPTQTDGLVANGTKKDNQ
jgi:DNA-binding PadR family transcriptional regulator